ncbi:RsmB/NOP family class I SAM-dependent RNA methyltransferase [Actinoalloteichus hymeniacidonis]|uniref:tRNA/rRNA cytosine-C5-methylase n=1 Tax=Actinoalloteichus hymeniacidonis TaxID=340345 RepID=A0AAC9HQI0_9PSEU|nr:transcription antitermination factor NusB [Actinoalloteichus hymeniacidonis]AOS63126.1 tRNA/rRNA cytosine-C5-methylase [Actinoalloteichus hymeniacidonis]MBB5908838.1 16S rRNA (cytosine967-C5)-methyltransferase [Actinoalloteichus hymeniacidonis]
MSPQPARRDRRGGPSGPPRGRGGPRRPPAQDPAREAALDTLGAVREKDAYANLVLPRLLRDRRIGTRDAALATELAYGASRTLGLLDAVLGECSERPLTEIDGVVLDGLRLGVYQLLRTRIPPHAAVSASVELVRSRAGTGAAGFANAVLRRATERDEDGWVEFLAPDSAEDPLGYLALRHPHPRWVAEAFAATLAEAGAEDELAELLAADDARPAVHLVARPGEISSAELAAITGGDEAPYSPYGVRLEAGAGDPADLEPVRERLAAVQDEGSQLAALALTRPQIEGSDLRWLDLCAGPGGKASLLGALVGLDGGTLDAVEPATHRADLIRSVVKDLPVRVHIADGRRSGLPSAAFDRVLVDAPCTGLGALRRRPEARWRRQPSDVAPLTTLQTELLGTALDLVRPGGVVAYVVCSPHLAETVEVATAAAARPGVTQLDARPFFPDVPGLGEGPGVQLWPHRHGTDAMFCALFRRD